MACAGIAARTRKQRFSWGVLLSATVYFLNLCTLNPLVHAETLHHTTQTKHLAAGHCSAPSAAPQTATPSAPVHPEKTIPLCCDLRGMHNRGTYESSFQIDVSLFGTFALLPPNVAYVSEEEQSLPIFQAVHSFHPPPLYLLHTILLI